MYEVTIHTFIGTENVIILGGSQKNIESFQDDNNKWPCSINIEAHSSLFSYHKYVSAGHGDSHL